MKILFAFFFAVALAPAASAQAQAPRIERVEIIEAGIYEAGPSNTLQFVKAADEIPGRVGVKFGFTYTLRGQASPVPVEMLVVTRMPQRLGQLDPGTGQRRFRIEDRVVARIGRANTSGYSFDQSWEIVPGEWIFEVWIAGQKRAEQKFNIVRP
jgi:hypothetical protein